MTTTLLRVTLACLALSAAVPGLQATISPTAFYDGFPFGRAWVQLLPPYNEHLIRDVGGFYLAFAILFAWAALRPSRELVVPLAAAWSVAALAARGLSRPAPGRFRRRRRGRADHRPGRRARAAGAGNRPRAPEAGTNVGMKMILCALLAAGLLAGCGGGDDEPDPAARSTSTPAATEAAEDAETEIRETFDDYNKALVERDFDDACEQLAPETATKLRENVKTLGVTIRRRSAPTCWT